MAEIKFDILEEIGVISTSNKNWNKELNIISWNERPGKYDLRDWDENHQKMGKGITLTKEELKSLKELLNQMDL